MFKLLKKVLPLLLLLMLLVACSGDDGRAYEKKTYILSLTDSYGAVSFDPAVFRYNIGIRDSDTVTITAVASAGTTLSIAGINATSGVGVPVTVTSGVTNIVVRAVASDKQPSEYVLRYEYYEGNYDVRITALASGAGVWNPAFSYNIMSEYNFGSGKTTEYNLGSLSLNPLPITVTAPKGKIFVDGSPGTSGNPVNVTLANVTTPQSFDVLVISSNNMLTNKKTITLTYYNPLKDARLSTITVTGAYNPTNYNPDSNSYGVSIYSASSNVTINAVATNSSATVSINGLAAQTGSSTRTINNVAEGVTNIPVVVVSQDGTVTVTNTVAVEYVWKPSLVSGSQSFDGGISNVRATLLANGTADTTLNTTLTGVITLSDFVGYPGTDKCFFLQDKDAGLYFFNATDFGNKLAIGNKVAVVVTKGKTYWGMPEITAVTSVTVLATKQVIYYQDAPTTASALSSMKGDFVRWSGTITESPTSANHEVGTFTGDLYFHVTSSLLDTLVSGHSGTFFGPINYSFSKYRMEITSSLFFP